MRKIDTINPGHLVFTVAGIITDEIPFKGTDEYYTALSELQQRAAKITTHRWEIYARFIPEIPETPVILNQNRGNDEKTAKVLP